MKEKKKEGEKKLPGTISEMTGPESIPLDWENLFPDMRVAVDVVDACSKVVKHVNTSSRTFSSLSLNLPMSCRAHVDSISRMSSGLAAIDAVTTLTAAFLT